MISCVRVRVCVYGMVLYCMAVLYGTRMVCRWMRLTWGRRRVIIPTLSIDVYEHTDRIPHCGSPLCSSFVLRVLYCTAMCV